MASWRCVACGSLLAVLFAATGVDSFRRRLQDIQDAMYPLNEKSSALQGRSWTTADEDQFRKLLLADIGATPGKSCPESGATADMGCALGCHCSWEQQCFKKSALVDAVAGKSFSQNGADWMRQRKIGTRIDVGECALSIPSLMCGSVLVFVGALLLIVVLRLALLGSCCGKDELVDEYGFPLQMPPSRTTVLKVSTPAGADAVQANK